MSSALLKGIQVLTQAEYDLLKLNNQRVPNKLYFISDSEVYVTHTELDLKQDITDNLLETDAKTIVGSINELNTDVDYLAELVGISTQALGDRRNGI